MLPGELCLPVGVAPVGAPAEQSCEGERSRLPVRKYFFLQFWPPKLPAGGETREVGRLVAPLLCSPESSVCQWESLQCELPLSRAVCALCLRGVLRIFFFFSFGLRSCLQGVRRGRWA